MQVVALHPDVIVVTSAFWQTTATALRGSEDEAFLLDSPVLPHELEALPGLLEPAGYRVRGLLVTHGDWDHLLGRYPFPDAPIGCGEATARRLHDEPGAAQRGLREFDDKHYVERDPLRLGGVQPLPVPGTLDVGDRTLELHEAPGHTADGTVVLAPWAGVLCTGDYLSAVEIPWINDELDAYRATLERLRGLVARAERVVPGHGGVLDRDRALAILEEDAAYLDALARDGEGAPLPPGRATKAQRSIHRRNAARIGRA